MPLITGGSGHEPFVLPREVGGVKSMLAIGPSGSGKSTLLGAICTAYLADGWRIWWLDRDYSSFVLAHLLGATYYDMGAMDSPPLCPLALLDQPNGIEWLDGWFERLFARWKLETDERQAEEFQFCLREARRTGVRTLSGLRALIPGEQQRVRRILRHYTTYWRHIFGGEGGDANGSRRDSGRDIARAAVTVFELSNLNGLGKRAAAPALELILHNIISSLDGTPTLILADEFWSLLGDETSAEWLFDAIRTIRKFNAGLIGASQSLLEIVNSPYRDLLLESCPGKIYLPNPHAAHAYGRKQYLDMGLNPHEVACIASAQPARQFYYSSPAGSRLATLSLGDVGKSICASTGYNDVQRARSIIREHGQLTLANWQPGLPVAATPEVAQGRRVAVKRGE